MGSCCKGRTIPAGPVQCKTLEQVGSGILLWPKRTANGVRIALRTPTSGFMEVTSYLDAYNCSGAVATMLRRCLGDIEKLADAGKLSRYTNSGVSLKTLMKLSRSQNVAARSPTHNL